MRVSIINNILLNSDATGGCILKQLQFFLERGDEVAIYVQFEPENIPAKFLPYIHKTNLHQLLSGQIAHLEASDLYIFHYSGYHLFLESMKELDKGMVVLNYHNVTPPELWRSEIGKEVLLHNQLTIQEFLPYVDFVVADSAFSTNQLADQYGFDQDRLRVIQLPVELDYFSPGPKPEELLKKYNLEDKQVILFVGRLAGNKRVDLLVEALAQIRYKLPNTVLLLVGDYERNPAYAEIMAHIKHRAEDLDVIDNIIFTGIVDELPPYYRLADVYATASLHEGFGVPLVEAMASGVPIVASNATAHPWVLGEAGLLVEPENVSDLANKISQILTDPLLIADLKERGLARTNFFSRDRYHQNWSEVIDHVLTVLPDQDYLRPNTLLDQPIGTLDLNRRDLQPTIRESLLLGKLGALSITADIVDWQYQLVSSVPLLGPLIVKIRRTLTSHLWEPYVDPTFKRQTNHNRFVVKLIRQLSEYLFGFTAHWQARVEIQQQEQTALSERLTALEQWMGLISDQIALIDIAALPDEQRETVGKLRSQIEEIRHLTKEGG